MNNNAKLVMILEKSSHNLEISKDGDDVILQGIFAQFGVVNNNDRIYEESEYLPHLEYLNKKISSNRLLGELDHPEKFDISLSKVSHVIESLEYDKQKRQLSGRVKLLDTPAGRIAKDLVKAGVPISISSRAAGLVESNKKVKIKKIFTYDLVADPGFENAVLNRINESLGIHSDLIAIYEMGEETNGFINEETPDTNAKTTHENMEFVTPAELNAYSLIVKEEIEKIHTKFASLNEGNDSSAINEKIEQLSNSVGTMQTYLDYLANTTDKTIRYTEYVAEKLDQVIGYTQYVAKTLDESIAYTEHVAEKTDMNIQYTEYLKEQVEKGIAYSEYLKECLEQTVDYTEYIAEKADQGIQYSEHVAEKAEKGIEYAEYLGEKMTETQSYMDYLKESLNKGISYTEYVAEQTQAVADYAEFTVNETKKQNIVDTAIVNEKVDMETEETQQTDYTSLTGKVDQLIESIKKQKVENVDESLRWKAYMLLNEQKREQFNSMDEATKQKVLNALNVRTTNSDEEIHKIFESALHPHSEKWIEEAPQNYKKIWESLEDNQKRTLIAQSRTYKLESDYQIKNFWETRPASLLTAKTSKLNENVSETPLNINPLGYSEEYLKMMSGLIGKFNRK
jgi:hypothetical protein